MWDTFSKILNIILRLNMVSKILNIILGLLTIYLYLENRKLKGFEIDKNLEIKKVELEELETEYKNEKENLIGSFATRGLYSSGTRIKAEQDLDNDYQRKIKKIKSEIEYLEKLKRYRWLFSK